MPKEETQFKDGESGNPNGRPKDTSTIKQIKKLGHREKLDKILWDTLQYHPVKIKKDLEKLKKTLSHNEENDQMTVLEMAIKRFAHDAIINSDLKKMDWIITRLFGKPKETIQHSGNIGNTNHEYNSMDEFLEKNAHMLKRLKDQKDA